jgi:DNA repair protein RecO (recombination protein O)
MQSMDERQRVELQEGFILHRRPYRESSLLLDVLSRDYGRVALVAKGVRGKRAKGGALLQPFNRLSLSWTGRSDLQTLTGVEWGRPSRHLDAPRLYCGLYMNELLTRFLHRHDPHPELFVNYAASVNALAEGAHVERTLRLFELTLLREVGYGLQLDCEAPGGQRIEAGKRYEYLPERGPTEAERPSAAAVDGVVLIGLRERRLDNDAVLADAKRLLRRVIAHHLGGKPLRSRTLFKPSK